MRVHKKESLNGYSQNYPRVLLPLLPVVRREDLRQVPSADQNPVLSVVASQAKSAAANQVLLQHPPLRLKAQSVDQNPDRNEDAKQSKRLQLRKPENAADQQVQPIKVLVQKQPPKLPVAEVDLARMQPQLHLHQWVN
jgi:hypothetical protein